MATMTFIVEARGAMVDESPKSTTAKCRPRGHPFVVVGRDTKAWLW